MPQDLLPYLLGALQWARAQQRFSEWYYAGIVIVAAFGIYAFAEPGALSQPFEHIVRGWWANVMAILASTQGISTASNLVHSVMPGDKPPVLLPVTNSQP